MKELEEQDRDNKRRSRGDRNYEMNNVISSINKSNADEWNAKKMIKLIKFKPRPLN